MRKDEERWRLAELHVAYMWTQHIGNIESVLLHFENTKLATVHPITQVY